MGGFENFNFTYGKAISDANVFFFEDDKKNKLVISEKIGKFQNGDKAQYLLFEYTIDDINFKTYIDRKSQEFLELTNIRPIVDNLNGIVQQCNGCKHIVLKQDITNSRGDTCVYCDKYACKQCKRMIPLIELDENRLCEKCRKKDEWF